MSEKKIKGYSWNPEAKMTFELSGLQVHYLTQLGEYLRGFPLITDVLMKSMIEKDEAKPMYEEDSVEDVIQKNPPTDSNKETPDETNKTSPTDSDGRTSLIKLSFSVT